MILCYLDTNKRNISIEEQRRIMTDYTIRHKNVSVDMFFEGNDISSLVNSLTSQKNTIITANIVCLGNTLREIRDNIEKLSKNQSTIISISENYKIIPDENALTFIQGLDYAIDIRNSLSSIITKKALSDKKAAGFKLGRKIYAKKCVLSGREIEIKQKLAQGITKIQLAKDLNVTQGTLYTFLKRYPELKPDFKGIRNA